MKASYSYELFRSFYEQPDTIAEVARNLHISVDNSQKLDSPIFTLLAIIKFCVGQRKRCIANEVCNDLKKKKHKDTKAKLVAVLN